MEGQLLKTYKSCINNKNKTSIFKRSLPRWNEVYYSGFKEPMTIKWSEIIFLEDKLDNKRNKIH